MHRTFVGGTLATEVPAALRKLKETIPSLLHPIARFDHVPGNNLKTNFGYASLVWRVLRPLRSIHTSYRRRRRIFVFIETFCEQLSDPCEGSVLILCNLLTTARLLYLLSAVSPRVEGIIPSSECQFELEVLEPGGFTKFLVCSVVTETSDLSLFRLLFRKCPGYPFGLFYDLPFSLF